MKSREIFGIVASCLFYTNLNAQVVSIQKHFRSMLDADSLVIIETYGFRTHFTTRGKKNTQCTHVEYLGQRNIDCDVFNVKTVDVEWDKCKNWVDDYNKEVLNRINAKYFPDLETDFVEEVLLIQDAVDFVLSSLNTSTSPQKYSEKYNPQNSTCLSLSVDYDTKIIFFEITKNFELLPFYTGYYDIVSQTWHHSSKDLKTYNSKIFSLEDISDLYGR